MTNPYQGSGGGQTDVISYSDETLSVLENSSLEININASIYSDETYIVNYIDNVFDNLNLVFDNCKSLIETAKEYINNNINNIPNSVKQPDLLDFDFSITGEVEISDQTSLAYVKLKDTNSHLNLRSGAGISSSIIGSLNNNTKLSIIDGGSSDPNWFKVKTEDGNIGFVSASYITSTLLASSNVSDVSNSTVSYSKGIVNTKKSNLNLRKSPGMGNNIITSIPKGSEIEILEYDPNSKWTKVKVGDTVGYVFSEYLKVENEA